MINKKCAILLAGLAMTMGGVGSVALAATEEKVIEEVIVTATRRVESAQEVPIALSAISGETLERAFAQDAHDLDGFAPNVLLQPVGAFQNASAFYIRGIGSSDIESTTPPGIGVFIDDVYMTRTSTALQDFVDIEAVEILRGPQGTLFGRNAIGGVVHIKHALPDSSQTDYNIGFTVGSRGRADFKGMFNIPLIDDELAIRVAAKQTNFDGWYDNDFTGDELGGQDHLTILPSIRWTPNDRLDLTIRGEYNKTRDDSWANVPYNACPSDPQASIPFAGGNDVVIDFIAAVFGQPADAASYCAPAKIDSDIFHVRHDQSYGSYSDFDVRGVTANISYDFPDMGTLTYIGNFRNVEEDVANDFDTTAYDIFSTRRVQEHDQMTHEFRFTSSYSDSTSIVAGLYYLDQEYELDQNTFGALVLGGPGIFGHSEQDNDMWAIYGQVDHKLNENWTVLLGIRYAEEHKEMRQCGVGFGDPVTRTCSAAATTILDDDWSNVSPKLGVQYYMDDNVMFYATYAVGFRSGGFNGRGNSPASIGPFDEEEATNYELGVKADMWNNRLRVNASVFLLDYDDLQRAIIRPTAAGGAGQETVTENVGSAESSGLELELTALLTDNFTVSWTLGYLKATNEEWCAPVHGGLAVDAPPAGFTQCGPTVSVVGGEFLVPVDATDVEPAHSPEWSSRLGLTYEIPTETMGSFTLGLDWRYRSESSLISAGFPPGTNDGVVNYNGAYVNPNREKSDVINFNVTWRDEAQNWRVSAFGKNLTDEVYLNTGTFVAGLFNFVSGNDPRHYGLEVVYSM